MKKFGLVVLISLIFAAAGHSQTAREIYSTAPSSITGSSARIVGETDSLLTLKAAGKADGEFKVVAKTNKEAIVGLAVNDCDASGIKFWSVKGGKWNEITARVLKPLGKDDVIAILKASPATIESLDQTIDISYFHKFSADSSDLELIARRQGSCEVAGRVHLYKFNGKRYTKH